MRVVYVFIIYDHIKYMRVGGQGHCGRQGQQGGEDQGGHWHKDVSLRLEFSSSRIWYAVVVVVAWKFLILSTYRTTFSISELAVDGTVVSKVNSEKKIREVADIRMYHIRWNFLQLGYDMLWWWWLTSKFLYFQLVWQPKCHVCWCLTTLWMTRLVTSWCIISVKCSSMKAGMW